MAKKDTTNVIAGRNPVREALERRPEEIDKVLIQKGGSGVLSEIHKIARDAGVQVQFVPPVKLGQVSGGANHQGVVAFANPVPYLEVHDLLSQVAPTMDDVRSRKPLLVLLDQITDVYNYGAILRSAVAAGADGVIVPRHGMAPLNATAVKASAGTAARIPIARGGNLSETIYGLKERGYWIAGAAGEGDTSVWDMDWDRPVAIVFGSEGEGLRQRVAGECDYLVSIPMRGPAESLNASVAAAILLFAAARVRD